MCLSSWLRPLVTTAPCPRLCLHRQQEEHGRQPEEPPQPQVEEQLPGLPAWALPAPTTRPGTATTRRQVGAGLWPGIGGMLPEKSHPTQTQAPVCSPARAAQPMATYHGSLQPVSLFNTLPSPARAGYLVPSPPLMRVALPTVRAAAGEQ